MTNALEIRNLTKEFAGKVVLDHISFNVEKGEIFGIIGMSGSGKTTILNHLIGFLYPNEGEILYRPSYILEEKSAGSMKGLYENLFEAKQMFGFSPQTPSFYPKLTVAENLVHFGSLYNLKKEAVIQNMNHLLTLTKLAAQKDKLAEHLSGGMQRRLNIACSLIHKPEILLLDEPTADLDPILREETWNFIQAINKQGTTVVVASHFLQELEQVSDRIAILHSGKILKYGSLKEIKKDFSQENVEIHIETDPENFKRILAAVTKRNITAAREEGNKLALYTTNQQQTLYEIAHLLKRSNIIAESIQVHKPSLREIFEYLEKRRLR